MSYHLSINKSIKPPILCGNSKHVMLTRKPTPDDGFRLHIDQVINQSNSGEFFISKSSNVVRVK